MTTTKFTPERKAELLRSVVPSQEEFIVDLLERDAPPDVLTDAWRILGEVHVRIALLEAGVIS